MSRSRRSWPRRAGLGDRTWLRRLFSASPFRVTPPLARGGGSPGRWCLLDSTVLLRLLDHSDGVAVRAPQLGLRDEVEGRRETVDAGQMLPCVEGKYPRSLRRKGSIRHGRGTQTRPRREPNGKLDRPLLSVSSSHRYSIDPWFARCAAAWLRHRPMSARTR